MALRGVHRRVRELIKIVSDSIRFWRPAGLWTVELLMITGVSMYEKSTALLAVTQKKREWCRVEPTGVGSGYRAQAPTLSPTLYGPYLWGATAA
jgi:hypothetical protein